MRHKQCYRHLIKFKRADPSHQIPVQCLQQHFTYWRQLLSIMVGFCGTTFWPGSPFCFILTEAPQDNITPILRKAMGRRGYDMRVIKDLDADGEVRLNKLFILREAPTETPVVHFLIRGLKCYWRDIGDEQCASWI